jgi:hypothetical protein
MGFRFSSFVAGAAENITETLKEDEKQAAAAASFGVKALKEQYDKVQAENRKISTELSENIKLLQENDPTATQDELFAAATNKTYMSAVADLVKTNPGSIKVKDVVKIKQDNPSGLTALEQVKKLTELPVVARAAEGEPSTIETAKPEGLFGIGTLRSRASARAGSKAEEQTAKAMGVSIEQLRAASGYKRPEIDAGAEFDFTSMQKKPQNAKEITDALEVAQIQAAQKFGKNSPQAAEATEKLEFVKSFETRTDKNQEARAERLMLERLDTKDPARIAEIDASLKDTRASILNHKKLTTLKDPKEKEATYREMKISVNDYVTTRMKEDKGFDWNKYVDFKTFTDPATDTTITSRTQKAGLSIEDQRKLFAKERQLTAQALKANGYVLQDGTPRTPVAQQLMLNFNISANELATNEAPTEKPLPMANAAPTAPAPAQPAAPATRPVPQLTREDQDALVWANNPANAGPKADAIKKKIQNKINGAN